MEYERAAVLRDRIKLLTNIQAKNTFSNSSIDDADVIALYQNEHGDCCVQIFFIRGGKNYGNRAYFPNNAEIDAQTLIENFIGQLYQRNLPPKRIILSHKLTSDKMLEEALLRLTGARTKISTPNRGPVKDLIGFVVENAKTALIHHSREKLKNFNQLKGVADLFEINELPKRIEVYDNSHIQGSNAVGCMVVVGQDGFNKKEYRTFNIKTVDNADDYSMLREVLKRRLKRLDADNYPDLVLIDGGKGHLSVAQEVLDSFGINDIKLVCISKGEDRNAGREFFHRTGKPAFQLPSNNSSLHYLQVIRDEAHRFAIETHRKRRHKQLITSGLDAIPQIGRMRKRLLLIHFGSLEAIRSASLTDLCKSPGISKKTAQVIYDFFHKN
jgi:excinuclease ABC subunit C